MLDWTKANRAAKLASRQSADGHYQTWRLQFSDACFVLERYLRCPPDPGKHTSIGAVSMFAFTTRVFKAPLSAGGSSSKKMQTPYQYYGQSNEDDHCHIHFPFDPDLAAHL
jgi:hypothetical protein